MATAQILVPLYALVKLNSITATPVAHGAIVTTHELRNALDNDPGNWTYIWTGGLGNIPVGDQPLRYEYVSADLPSAILGAYKQAFYLRIENNAYNPLGSDYNELRLFRRSTNGSAWGTLLLSAKYGDGTLSNPWVLFNVAVSGSEGHPVDAQVAASGTIGFTQRYFAAAISTQNLNVGANYSVYEAMHGLLVSLPINMNLDRSWVRDSSGGEVYERPFMRPKWRGEKSVRTRRKFTASFSHITKTQRDLLIEIVKWCRGSIPFLFMEDDSNRETWFKATCKSLKWREPSYSSFFVDMALEEV